MLLKWIILDFIYNIQLVKKDLNVAQDGGFLKVNDLSLEDDLGFYCC